MGTVVRSAPVLVLGVVLLAGCDLTAVEEVEGRDVVVAEIYLRPGTTQEAFLYRTLPGVDGSFRVDGARVSIRAETGPELVLRPAAVDDPCAVYTVLPEGSAGTCYLAPAEGYVQPGGSYHLEIETADGRRLSGTTTVPADFRIIRPSVDTCGLGGAELELAWTQAAGAWSYQAVARFEGLGPGLAELGIEDPPDRLDLVGLAVGRADTTITFPGEFGVFDRFLLDRDVAVALQQGLPYGASADIVVAAGDRNWVNWVRGGNFNPSGQVRVPSITGDGTGVFGSLNARRVTVLGSDLGWPSCQ